MGACFKTTDWDRTRTSARIVPYLELSLSREIR
jgi:hypothetical protein